MYFPVVINFHSRLQKINLDSTRFMSEFYSGLDSIEVSNELF